MSDQVRCRRFYQCKKTMLVAIETKKDEELHETIEDVNEMQGMFLAMMERKRKLM